MWILLVLPHVYQCERKNGFFGVEFDGAEIYASNYKNGKEEGAYCFLPQMRAS